MIIFAILIIAAYLCGSLCSAIFVCRALHLPDPRTQGSGNPGASNVLRIGGAKAAALTLAGDALKGFIPVMLAHLLRLSDFQMACVGFAAFLGHLYPLFFGFKGGKGVATALGVIVALNWMMALGVFAVWFITLRISKITALSALVASLSAPFFMLIFGFSWRSFLLMIMMVILLFWSHRSNILRMLNGVENSFKKKS